VQTLFRANTEPNSPDSITKQKISPIRILRQLRNLKASNHSVASAVSAPGENSSTQHAPVTCDQTDDVLSSPSGGEKLAVSTPEVQETNLMSSV
jgi:hypothetical protein